MFLHGVLFPPTRRHVRGNKIKQVPSTHGNYFTGFNNIITITIEVQFYPCFKFYIPLFLGVVIYMYANEFERNKPGIKLNLNIIIRQWRLCLLGIYSVTKITLTVDSVILVP